MSFFAEVSLTPSSGKTSSTAESTPRIATFVALGKPETRASISASSIPSPAAAHSEVLEKHNDSARQRDHNHEKGHVIEQVLPVEDHPFRQLRRPEREERAGQVPPADYVPETPEVGRVVRFHWRVHRSPDGQIQVGSEPE